MDAMQVYVNVSICVYVVYCRVAIENELLCSILLERFQVHPYFTTGCHRCRTLCLYLLCPKMCCSNLHLCRTRFNRMVVYVPKKIGWLLYLVQNIHFVTLFFSLNLVLMLDGLSWIDLHYYLVFSFMYIRTKV
jgi:hypothetical protein